MANGDPGTLDLLRQLTPYQWMALVGTSLQSLGIGRPGQRVYPFGPLGVFGMGLSQQAEQAKERGRRGALWSQAKGQLRPEEQAMFGPLAIQGGLTEAQILSLYQHGAERRKRQEATGYWKDLFAPVPGEEVTVAGEDLPPTETTETESLWGPQTIRRPPRAPTLPEYMQRLQAIPENVREYQPPPTGLAMTVAGAEEARSLFAFYRRFLDPESAKTAVESTLAMGMKPADVLSMELPAHKFSPGGYYTERLGQERPTFTEVIPPSETARLQRVQEFRSKVAEVREAAARQKVNPLPTIRRLVEEYGIDKDDPVRRGLEAEEKLAGQRALLTQRLAPTQARLDQAERHYKDLLTRKDAAGMQKTTNDVLRHLEARMRELATNLTMDPEVKAAELQALQADWNFWVQRLKETTPTGLPAGPRPGGAPVPTDPLGIR